ncbi:hypothetical protein EDB89DRAFT_1654653 [Lactarius sanguifluus]|nr:hypothetical protein EDB89DRAFT_1654653 [Lactarius sanguifluus]
MYVLGSPRTYCISKQTLETKAQTEPTAKSKTGGIWRQQNHPYLRGYREPARAIQRWSWDINGPKKKRWIGNHRLLYFEFGDLPKRRVRNLLSSISIQLAARSDTKEEREKRKREKAEREAKEREEKQAAEAEAAIARGEVPIATGDEAQAAQRDGAPAVQGDGEPAAQVDATPTVDAVLAVQVDEAPAPQVDAVPATHCKLTKCLPCRLTARRPMENPPCEPMVSPLSRSMKSPSQKARVLSRRRMKMRTSCRTRRTLLTSCQTLSYPQSWRMRSPRGAVATSTQRCTPPPRVDTGRSSRSYLKWARTRGSGIASTVRRNRWRLPTGISRLRKFCRSLVDSEERGDVRLWRI